MPLQVHHRHIVARVGEKDMQQVLRPQAEAGVVLAGVAAEPGRVMDCPVHHQPDLVFRVIGQAQHAGGAGGAKERRVVPSWALRTLVWKGLPPGMVSR